MRELLTKQRGSRCVALLLSTFFCTTGAVASNQQGPAAQSQPVSVTVAVPRENLKSSGVSIGADVSPGSFAAFVGGVHALNGDLSTNGFLISGGLTIGEYEQGNADVSFQAASVLVGYQHIAGPSRVAFFVGPDFSHNGKGASPEVRGSSWNLRAVAEASTAISPRVDLIGWGTYSTFENQYMVLGRALYRPGEQFKIGPEASVSGGDTYEQYRLGAHASVPVSFGAIGLSVGHAWGGRSGDNDGLYANAILSLSF